MEQMFQMFQQLSKRNNPTETPSADLKVAEKINCQNYTKWCKVIQVTIKGRGRLNHIIDDPPSITDPNYKTWKQRTR